MSAAAAGAHAVQARAVAGRALRRARVAAADQALAVDIDAARQHEEHCYEVQQPERQRAARCPFRRSRGLRECPRLVLHCQLTMLHLATEMWHASSIRIEAGSGASRRQRQ